MIFLHRRGQKLRCLEGTRDHAKTSANAAVSSVATVTVLCRCVSKPLLLKICLRNNQETFCLHFLSQQIQEQQDDILLSSETSQKSINSPTLEKRAEANPLSNIFQFLNCMNSSDAEGFCKKKNKVGQRRSESQFLTSDRGFLLTRWLQQKQYIYIYILCCALDAEH